MAYGHAHKIAGIAAGTPAAGGEEPAPPVDPVGPTSDPRATAPQVDPRLYDRPDVREILARRDIAALIRVLKDDGGLTQRRIAELIGMSQSEVSDILSGRQVIAYDVLVRIADRLGIQRGAMGLSYGQPGAYREGVTVASPEEVAEMFRRHVLALAPIAALAHNPLTRLAELLERSELPGPSPVPLPSRLGAVHVAKVRNLTRRLHEARRAYGSDPEVSSAAAAGATRLLGVPGPDAVKKALKTAVSELHIEAGWGAFDADLYDRTMHHYARGLELATEVGDAYCQAVALGQAGLATVEHGQPNEGLKILQFAGVKALDIPLDLDPSTVVVGQGSRAAMKACAGADSATALSRLDYPEAAQAADTALAESRELWQPTPADPNGDLDRPTASLELDRGRLDAAEPFAVASVRRWEDVSPVRHTQSAIVLATIHVRAGEQRGLQLAHSAVTAAARLTSIRARKRLKPLVDALEARSNSDAQQLARMARKVAAMRA